MSADKKVVTRFAPSPTGYIHIGNVRSAIYPYLVARQAGGTFILRIEDTDRARYVEGAAELIEETLTWLGLEWDEGPGVGGPHAPYFQTERGEIYAEWAQRLIDAGRAYADVTPPEKVEEYRRDAAAKKTPFLYRNYRPDNPPEWRKGVPLRLRAEPKDYAYTDAVYGELRMGPETQDDIILMKADGLPTYNFAHIVDDATMGVTHVARGQEYLPSMGNYLALYDALGIPRPVFVHLPHILGPTGTKKLSKRDGAKSVTDYRADGVLPEAMLNFLACLGWNDGTEKELYTKAELVAEFAVERIQKAPARFDGQKLLWLNGQWIRRLYVEDPAEFYARTREFWPVEAEEFQDAERQAVLAVIYDRLRTLADLRIFTPYFFADPRVDLALVMQNKFLRKLPEEDLRGLLQQAQLALEAVEEWTVGGVQDALNSLLTSTGKKPAELFSLLRLAISMAPFSPDLAATMVVLGKAVTLARVGALAAALGAD